MPQGQYKNKTRAQYRKEYWAKNPDYLKNRRMNKPFNYLLQCIKNRSKTRNYECNLDVEYLKSIYPNNNKCPILNIKLVRSRNGNGQDNSPSLDRIDSNKGYIKGNVMFMCQLANRMKNNANIKQLKLFGKWTETL
jgi:hypothetical protein